MQPRDRFAEVWVIFQWSWVWFPLILIYQVLWAHSSLLGVAAFLGTLLGLGACAWALSLEI